MNQPTNLNLFELLNYCVSHQPGALGVFALNSRVKEIRMPRQPAASGSCFHRPSEVPLQAKLTATVNGEVHVVETLERICDQCGEAHALAELCSQCGEAVPYHDFPGREPRIALITLEFPERVGKNLKGPEEDRAFLVCFHIDRAVYDQFIRRSQLADSGLVLPLGAKI